MAQFVHEIDTMGVISQREPFRGLHIGKLLFNHITENHQQISMQKKICFAVCPLSTFFCVKNLSKSLTNSSIDIIKKTKRQIFSL